MDERAEPDPERDLERAEVMESASVQNAVATGSPMALVAVPLANLLVAVQARLRRLTRRDR